MANDAKIAAAAGVGKPEKYFLEPSPASAIELNFASRSTPKHVYTHAIGAPHKGCVCSTKKYISIAGAVQNETASRKQHINLSNLNI